MPLLVITGIPSCGKSRISQELNLYFSQHLKKKVHIISENKFIGKDKNSVYNDSLKEKVIRDKIKANVTRLINNDDLIIIDSLNYIKGYRYELYCISKEYKTTHCVLHCITPEQIAWQWNEARDISQQYLKHTYDALIMRYEAPDNRNRWDCPLFSVFMDDKIPFEAIDEALYQCKVPPANHSTQLQPLSTNNFLHELDKCTQEIVSLILEMQKSPGVSEGSLKVPNTTELLVINRKINLAELSRIRRQFITYTKLHPVDDPCKLRTLFVQYLNKTINL